MEYKLKASIRKTMNADRSYTLTGVGTYDFVGGLEDGGFISKVTQVENVVNIKNDIVYTGSDDKTNTCKVLEVVNLLEE